MQRTMSIRALAALAVVALAAPAGARADTLAIDFEAYTPGAIHLQDGWRSAGAAGSGCAVYDHAVAANAGAPYSYPSFGAQSLRMSNAVTSGCFGDQTFSKSLAEAVGEPDAAHGGYSAAPTRTHFAASWEFASTVPDALQSGLSVVASPDRGDGARMSWIQMTDTADGLAVNFYDFQEREGENCDGNGFVFTPVATGLDRTIPHTIAVTMDVYPGPANDVVRVFVDGVLGHTGTSWEDYFRACENTPESRTVDSVLFRTGGGAAPGTAGKGFLIDNLSTASAMIPTAITSRPAVARVSQMPELYLFELEASLGSALGALAGEPVTFSAGDTELCTAQTDANGTATCDALLSAADVVLAGGYTASFAGDELHAAASGAGALIG